MKDTLFIVRADLASDRDFHLAAERAELSDFEFYCIFERIGALETDLASRFRSSYRGHCRSLHFCLEYC